MTKQLELFTIEPEVIEPMPLDSSDDAIKAVVNDYNYTGNRAKLFSAWDPVNVASKKLVNKRLGALRVKDREALAGEVALLFFERIIRRRSKGNPYTIKRLYSVLWDLSTWVLYQDKQKQHDREYPDERF
jgi:hypothetical protein